MEQIIPDNLDKELNQLIKHNKRSMLVNEISNVLMLMVAVGLLILIWGQINSLMASKAYDEGYERGYEQASWDYIDNKINSSDYGTTYMEPRTDAEIWEKYHDCDMYGLPEYARPYCENKAVNKT